MNRVLAIVLGLVLVLCGTYAGLLAWFDGERIRAVLSEGLSENYGVDLTVGGLERSFSFRPLIRIEAMRVANAKHRDQPLVEVESASFRLNPWTLLVGPVTLDEFMVDGVVLSVPVDDEGALYWDPVVEAISSWLHRFDWSLPHFRLRALHAESRHVSRSNDLLASVGVVEGTMPRLADLALVATDVSANLETTLPLRLRGTAQLDRIALGRQDGELPVTFSAAGRIGDKLLHIDAAGGNLLDDDPMERDPLQATIEIGPSNATIRGTMSRDADTHIALHVTYDEHAPADLPALHIEAGVSDPGNGWRLTDVRATQGPSTLTGMLEIRNEDGRRVFDGSATVTNVEYPKIGDEPKDAKKGELEEAEGKGLRQALPEGDLYTHLLEGIEKFDADFDLRAEQSRLFGLPFDWINIRTTLDRGALRANVEDSRLRESSLKGSFSITPAQDQSSVGLSMELLDAELSELTAGLDRLDGVTGTVDGGLSFQAVGRDMPSVLGSAGGRLTLFLEDGSVPDELAKKVAGDVLAVLFADFDDDDKTLVRCAIVDFDIKDGIASARRMAMSTSEFLIFGKGKIDLPKGTLDLRFEPRATEFSLVSMTLPFRIHGSLDDLRFDSDVSEGVTSLLTPMELGSSDEVNCTPPKMTVTGS